MITDADREAIMDMRKAGFSIDHIRSVHNIARPNLIRLINTMEARERRASWPSEKHHKIRPDEPGIEDNWELNQENENYRAHQRWIIAMGEARWNIKRREGEG